jgi:hypothetical protein
VARLILWRLATVAVGLLALASMIPAAHAQDPDDLQRGVARISLMNGDVSVRRGDSGDWVAGIINAPLLTDDRISTAPNSRAEVQFDNANILRIGGNAEVRLALLEAGRYQMEVARGTVTFRVLRPTNANIEVDTPNVSVRPSKQGVYRISVNENGETEIAARQGDTEIFTPRGTQAIASGQMMIARGTPDNPEFQIVSVPAADDWDRWNDARDGGLLRSPSNQYVGPGVYGAEDLDAYGQWTDVAPYGQVWRPTGVGPDWAPYQSGRWVWEDWYGWTWVSYDPWGWAPYHYGRWFYQAGFGWCWYPGLRGVRHYWSPALVGFFGYGGGVGFGVGFGFGNIGWVPLAPYEVFHPWWGRGFYGRTAFERNFTAVNVVNVYRNAGVRNAITGVSTADFRAGRFANSMRMSGAQVGQAGMIRGQVPLTPSSANLHFSGRAVSYTPRSSANTQFVRQQQPNGAQRMAFGRSSPAGGVPQAGWRRFGEPITSNSFQNSRQPATGSAPNTNRNGWQRFGEPAAPQRSSQPAPSAPRQSAPSYSAPRGGGGAGGGGGRPSGGGGSSRSGGHR